MVSQSFSERESWKWFVVGLGSGGADRRKGSGLPMPKHVQTKSTVSSFIKVGSWVAHKKSFCRACASLRGLWLSVKPVLSVIHHCRCPSTEHASRKSFLSGPVSRDTARLSRTDAPLACALWGFWCLNMTNWVRHPRPLFWEFPPWRACEVEVRYPRLRILLTVFHAQLTASLPQTQQTAKLHVKHVAALTHAIERLG